MSDLASAWMWTPDNIGAFESAVKEGALDERHDFDAKRELPGSNKELAKDIAAMTTDGGMLVYGVAEDENDQPRVLSPIDLNGVTQRIDQVAQHSISGNPHIEFQELRRDGDEGRGYLLVRIPASPEAPHQVTVGDDRRFYGRSATGNRRLSETEIARLYERRRSQAVDREAILGEVIAASGAAKPESGVEGFLHAFAYPAVPDDALWDTAVAASQGEQPLLQALREAIMSVRSPWGGTSLSSGANWRRRGADKWSFDSAANYETPPPLRKIARADLSMDGRCALFYGGAADQRGDNFIVYERGIVLTLAQFLAAVATLYERGGVHGPVDVGTAVVGIQGAISSFLVNDLMNIPTPYAEDVAIRHLRCQASELQDDLTAITRSLTGRLVRALTGHDLDPLAR